MSVDGITAELVSLDSDELIAEIAANDAAVFIGGRGFGFFEIPSGEIVPCVEIDIPWLEERVEAGTVTCEAFGIGTQIGTENVMVTTPAPYLHFRLNVCPLYIWLDDTPTGWLDDALKRCTAIFPQRPDGRHVFLATGPMSPGGRLIPGQGIKPTGRNEPCPCGSGQKFKRCHGL